MKTIYGIPLGRMKETVATLENPELWAMKTGSSLISDYTFKKWPNRISLAKSIRMQQRGPHRQDHWGAIVKLSDGEGY